MSQVIFDTIDPVDSGTELASILNDFKDAVVSGFIGSSRPTELDPGGYWVDNTNDPTSWSLRLYTGVDDVEVVVIDLVNAVAAVTLAVDSFIIRKVSADTVGAVMELVKRRIATNGQVLSGDVVGEIRAVGRDDVSGNPVVAKIIFTAGENQTATAFGGTLSFQSTPLGQAALVEHMKFIGGIVETVVPHKTNAAILAGQNVATSATIAQLSGDKVLVEMTGSTVSSIQGLNSAHASKVVTIHNRSSVNVTLEHQDAGAAAADRFLFPESKDIVLLPQDSATLYYCTADTRWKIQNSRSRFVGFQNDTFLADVGSFVAPASVTKARITAHSKKTVFAAAFSGTGTSRALDIGKSLFAWGQNVQGNLGVGDVTNRSSPVAVLGGLKFTLVSGTGGGSTGITESGAAFAWGANTFGNLGVGDVTPRSSPVAVLGGLTFKKISSGANHVLGLAPDGSLFAWGLNANGQLGVGNVVPRSSPVAVLGGLKFREILASSQESFAITLDGDLYAWGDNPNGQLGVGDVTPRSSPVAVLGGLKFRSIVCEPGFGSSVIGITDTSLAFAWGLNGNGQLGVGNVIPRSSPVAVLGGLTFREVSLGAGSHALGTIDDGSAFAWGGNTGSFGAGQLGVGDVVPRSSPVAVLGGLKFKKIQAIVDSSFGITEDGDMYSWGDNNKGQLGVGNAIPRSSPVAVVGGLSFQEMYLEFVGFGPAVFGLSTDGRIFSWGDNGSGELGLGDVAARSSPVAVLGGLSMKTQDDSATVLDIPITGGNTYAIKLGAGPCFFGSFPLGNDIIKAEVTYVI